MNCSSNGSKHTLCLDLETNYLENSLPLHTKLDASSIVDSCPCSSNWDSILINSSGLLSPALPDTSEQIRSDHSPFNLIFCTGFRLEILVKIIAGISPKYRQFMIPINYGMITWTQLPITSRNFEVSGSTLRRLSISFSQETIWFEVGMLRDAT